MFLALNADLRRLSQVACKNKNRTQMCLIIDYEFSSHSVSLHTL